jgi:hypothetical protein
MQQKGPRKKTSRPAKRLGPRESLLYTRTHAPAYLYARMDPQSYDLVLEIPGRVSQSAQVRDRGGGGDSSDISVELGVHVDGGVAVQHDTLGHSLTLGCEIGAADSEARHVSAVLDC